MTRARLRERLTRPGLLLVAILAAALALRLGFVAAFHRVSAVRLRGRRVAAPAEQPLFADAAEYLRMSRNILAGRGLGLGEHCRIGRMPGYPVFLALVQSAFGRGLWAVRVAQAIVGTATVWLVWLLARELFGPREAVVAGVLAGAYPVFVMYAALVLSETLFAALLTWGALCLAGAAKHERWLSALLAGVLFGLAALVRASLLPCVLLLAIGWAAWWRPRGRALRHAMVMVAAFVVVMAPWAVRNWYASGGHVVVTTLRAGASLYEALNPKADGGPMLECVNDVPRPAGMTEYERDRQLARLAVEFAAEHPGRAAWLALVKLGRLWNPVPNAPAFRTPLLMVAVAAPYVVVVALALVGLARSWRLGPVVLILVLPLVYHSLLHAVFVGSIRYRVALMPLVMVLAAHGAVVLWAGRRAA